MVKRVIYLIILGVIFSNGIYAKSSHKRTHYKKRVRKRVKYHAVLSKRLNKIYKKVSKKTDINRKALKKALIFYQKNLEEEGLSSKYLALPIHQKGQPKRRFLILLILKNWEKSNPVPNLAIGKLVLGANWKGKFKRLPVN